jgi:hypothetical protein
VSEIHGILIETLGEFAPSYATVKNWVAQCKCVDFLVGLSTYQHPGMYGYTCSFLNTARQLLLCQVSPIIEGSRSHSDTPHSVGLLWTSDQPEAETSTGQHTTLTTDIHLYHRRDSNPKIPASERPQNQTLERAATRNVTMCILG